MKFSTRIFISVLLILLPVSASAQRLSAHRGTVKKAYNYWFYTPSQKPQPGSVVVPVHEPDSTSLYDVPSVTDSASWDLEVVSQPPVIPAVSGKPLVIFLHGASLCGSNLARVRRYGTIDAISRGLKLDAYVLAPQNPGGAWNPAKINRIVDWALDNYDIDSTRIYVLGMSLGGYGTIDYAAASPSRVAAAMALCGGGTSKTLGNLNQVPLAILHGTGDRAVPWTASQAVVNAMQAAGDTTRLIYRLLPKQSHGALARYFYIPEVYEWLFQHTLLDTTRTVNRDYYFGIDVTDNAFRRLKKLDQPLLVDDSHKASSTKGASTKGASSAEVDESSTGVHVVKSGDTLSRIAKLHRTTIAHLCAANNISRTSVLRIGQKIRY